MMQLTELPFNEVPHLSERDKAYQNGDKRLRDMVKYEPVLSSFTQVIADKRNQRVDRALLKEVILDQYEQIGFSPAQQENVDFIEDDNSFCVTTAHQASILMGPLYTIYKCISCIRLAEELRTEHPNINFYPVFVLGSEDHDFEEISTLHLFRKSVSWEKEATGPTGRLDTEGLTGVIEEVKQILGDSDRASEMESLFISFLEDSATYGDFAFRIVNYLFREKGMLILNMDNKKLKHQFIPAMKDDLLGQHSHDLIMKSLEKLENAGFSAQATPREINLFYLGAGGRDRIVFEDGKYQILDTELVFSKEEIIDEVENHPERFSPNVVLRPIYQETVLPNLAYIGGGGELAYWMERLAQFEHFNINFPVLIRRDSVMWIDKGTVKRMEKLDLRIEDLFRDVDQVLKEFAKKQSDIDIDLSEESRRIKEIFGEIADRSKKIEKTLSKSVAAEEQKTLNSLEVIEKKMIRAEKNNQEQTMNQIRNIYDKLFPENGLQERYDNYLAYYLRYGDQFFEALYEYLNPLNKAFKVIHEKID